MYNKLSKMQDNKEKFAAVDNHSQEIEEKFGPGEVITLRSRNTYLWDWARKEKERNGKHGIFSVCHR